MKNQQGIALVQVIFIIALLASLVSYIQLEERRAIDRTFQKLQQNQAREYLISGESIAIQGLSADKNANSIDHLDEEWAQIFGPLPLDAGLEGKTFPGSILIQITDLNGVFNLNWLHKDSGRVEEYQQGFMRLLNLLNVESGIAQKLTEWFDEESGADYNYLNAEPAYQPSLRQMTEISELRRIELVSNVIYSELENEISAIPADSSVNLNTVTINTLLAAAPTLLQVSAENIVSLREGDPYQDVNDMLNRLQLTNAELKNLPVATLAVQSEYFKIQSLVELQGQFYYMTSLVNRNKDNKIRVLSRSFIPFTPKETE